MQLFDYGGLDKNPVQPQTNDQEASRELQSEDVKKAVIIKELPLTQANSSLNLGQPKDGNLL